MSKIKRFRLKGCVHNLKDGTSKMVDEIIEGEYGNAAVTVYSRKLEEQGCKLDSDFIYMQMPDLNK